jgi:uncharacterized membrane protein
MFMDWVDDHIGWVLFSGALLALAGVFWLISEGVKADRIARDQFMAECVQHRQNYECVAMWRQGQQTTDTVVVPMPVVVGR